LAVMVAGPLYRIAPRYREIVKLIRLNIAALDSVSVAAPARS
jgi:hypothetical protein